MTLAIKAIETQYAGVAFRSRLEARWAMFFDALRIPWEYEPEGYTCTSGWYLPDFRLRCAYLDGLHEGRLVIGETYPSVWFEVKPDEPKPESLVGHDWRGLRVDARTAGVTAWDRRWSELALATTTPLVVAFGIGNQLQVAPPFVDIDFWWHAHFVHWEGAWALTNTTQVTNPEIQHAYSRARSARF